ncbi:hypothetical protein BHM03_00038979 [Ensete ventricosum]|nr:hypothetical protein BHM03_00038979 [Ensete ventricosum]
MAVAQENSSDNLDGNDALLLDDNLSISVEGLYAFLDEQPFDPVDDQSQVRLPSVRSKLWSSAHAIVTLPLDVNVSHYVDFGCDLYSDSDQKDFDELRAGISQQNRFKMYESYADVELDKALASVGSLIQMADTDEPLPDMCVEQNYLDDVSLKSESSIDSSPLPSTGNSIFDDAHIPAVDASLKWFPHSFPNLHNKRQKTSTKTGREELVQESHYIQHNSLKHSDDDLNVSSTVSCISVEDDDAGICILDDVSNFAHPLPPPVIVKNHTMLEQSGYIQTYQPRLGGTRLKADDERLTLRLALQVLVASPLLIINL